MVNNTPIYSSWSSSFSFLKENMTFLVDLDILLIEAQNPCDSNHPGLYSRPYSCASILHGLLSRSYNELSRLSLCQVLLIVHKTIQSINEQCVSRMAHLPLKKFTRKSKLFTDKCSGRRRMFVFSLSHLSLVMTSKYAESDGLVGFINRSM